ncbi:major facilitator superfamily domain-containing protein [Piptocephalis cylindrospora]|uniref:Major facilitator superfamily domain-containing protein n=1 Tax=Piptocephalis cylindrospora TaxID=1907219 RepID=A0A4P9Y751_9FUNG|nr:major facilitator superfamily domain-containing protein [Piptocephalis cylindrospora]|eukprot:RKP14937.1 major facilitator superfamily domain-containing protein [Piptocephalis cylindrospora]
MGYTTFPRPSASPLPLRAPEVTPLPIKPISILLLARSGEPIAFTILFPFVYFMVRDFYLYPDPKQVAIQVGWVASSFSLAQMFSGLPWGALSDRIGRRPVILMGLMGTTLSMLLFGLSHSLVWAISTRIMCGLLNGNVGVVKSALAELTDETNQAKGFAFLPMIWGLGSVLGPMIGGFLSNPAQVIGGPFDTAFWRANPYFLPCATAASVTFAGFLVAFFFLEETMPSKPPSPRIEEGDCSSEGNSEASSLLPKPISPSTPLPSSYIASILPKASRPAVACLVGVSFLSVVSDELYPLWAAARYDVGGLGFDTGRIGMSLSVGGLTILLTQLLLFPRLERRHGKHAIFRISMASYFLIWLFLPLVTFLVDTPWMWPCLLLLVALKSWAGTFAFASANLMLVDAARQLGALGKVNGSAQCLVALGRTIGPAIGGFTWGHCIQSNLPWPLGASISWWILAISSLFVACLSGRS